MGIQIHFKNGLYCTEIACDQCGERIEKASAANYYFVVVTAEPTEMQPAYFAHKRCDHAFEQTHPLPQGSHWCWNPLEVFLLFLGNDLKYDWNVAIRTAKMLHEAEQILG